MTEQDATLESISAACTRPSNEAVSRLADALERLDADWRWLVEALTEKVLAMPPVSREGMSANQMAALTDSGATTEEDLDEAELAVAAGGLQYIALRAWLTGVCETLSVDEMCGYLRVDEEGLRQKVEAGQVAAVVIAGRIRFPGWQCNSGSQAKLLPGLPEVLSALTEGDAGWRNDSSFMNAPKSALVAWGRQTPVEWLRDGHPAADVVTLIRERD